MRTQLKIDFSDFWEGFNKEDNYFYNILSKHYNVVITDNPDLLIYSCYSSDFKKYRCTRLFYTAENIRPNFSDCSYAISFDYINSDNHYRLPLYALYIDHKYSDSFSPKLEALTKRERKEVLSTNWENREKFCCMVVSNGKAKERLDFFQELSKYRHVDSGGAVLNNMNGERVKDKLLFIKDYRFVISFENAAFPGYVTEKLIEPLFMGCIPIYWGNPIIERDFNTKRFLNYSDFGSSDELIRKIVELDSDPEQALEILCQPIFPDNQVPEFILDRNVLGFLDTVVRNLKSQAQKL